MSSGRVDPRIQKLVQTRQVADLDESGQNVVSPWTYRSPAAHLHQRTYNDLGLDIILTNPSLIIEVNQKYYRNNDASRITMYCSVEKVGYCQPCFEKHHHGPSSQREIGQMFRHHDIDRTFDVGDIYPTCDHCCVDDRIMDAMWYCEHCDSYMCQICAIVKHSSTSSAQTMPFHAVHIMSLEERLNWAVDTQSESTSEKNDDAGPVADETDVVDNELPETEEPDRAFTPPSSPASAGPVHSDDSADDDEILDEFTLPTLELHENEQSDLHPASHQSSSDEETSSDDEEEAADQPLSQHEDQSNGASDVLDIQTEMPLMYPSQAVTNDRVKEAFDEEFKRYKKEHGIRGLKIRKWLGQNAPLHFLYVAVMRRGGYDHMFGAPPWREVRLEIMNETFDPQRHKNVGHAAQTLYESNLKDFETYMRTKGATNLDPLMLLNQNE